MNSIDRLSLFLFRSALFGVIAAAFGVLTVLVLQQRFESESATALPELREQLAVQQRSVDDLQQLVGSIQSGIEQSANFQPEVRELEERISDLQQLLEETNNSLSLEIATLASGDEADDAVIENLSSASEEQSADLATNSERIGQLELGYQELKSSQTVQVDAVVEPASETVKDTPLEIMEGMPMETRDGLPLEIADGIRMQDARPEVDLTLVNNDIRRLETLLEEIPGRIEALKSEVGVFEERLNEEATSREGLVQRIDTAETQIADLETGFLEGPTTRSVALLSIRATAEAGAPFDDMLVDAGFDVEALPETIGTHAYTGIASLSQLQRIFDEEVHFALKAAGSVNEDSSVQGGVRAFLSSLVQVRSLTPVEGGTADAILSRAESALRKGDLESAVSLVQALPVPARQSLSEWLEMAKTRLEVLAALDDLHPVPTSE